jgi:hypothetical protein
MGNKQAGRSTWQRLALSLISGGMGLLIAISADAATLEAAAGQLASVSTTTKTDVLAAAVSQEGHWTFLNKTGEKFTAASADELQRAVRTLIPDQPDATQSSSPRLTLLLTDSTVFDHRPKLKDLPRHADLRVAVGDSNFALRLKGDAAVVSFRPNIAIDIADKALFQETVWQLNRPLAIANLRILALETGGPQTLAPLARLDPATGRPVVDQLDPLRAADGLRSLRGQTVVMVGRSEGKLLYVRGSSGPEQSVILADLLQAAEAADVNLILLQSSAARQPGARNWLWQKTEVAGVKVNGRPTLADFLSLGADDRPLLISGTTGAEPGSVPGRISLTVAADASTSILPGILDAIAPVSAPVSAALGGVMSGLTGKIVVANASLHLQSRERASQLGRRWISNVPFGWVELYGIGLLLGLLGWRWTSRWWQRFWPQETRKDYGSAFGYHSARAVRAMLMPVVFLPVAGFAVLPAILFGLKPKAVTTSQAPGQPSGKTSGGTHQ